MPADHWSLSRIGDNLEVEFRRFDDDQRSTLRGNDVWAQLVADGRAVIRDGL